MKASEALLARLRADPQYDACVLRIAEGDYGCEEPLDPPLVYLALLLADGSETSREIPEARLDALRLQEGSLCRLAEVSPPRESGEERQL